jgi:hypothetical protein
MSSTLKFSLLALISSAAAVPHYGHSRFHRPSGGYGTGNSTVVAPTGTAPATYPGEQTTTIDETTTSTTTIVSTVYLNPSPVPEQPSSAVVADLSSASAGCGPETVYITATNQVTVTVTAGESSSSSAATPSSAVEVVPTSSVAASSAVYEAQPPVVESSAAPSSSAAEASLTLSLPQKGVESPTPTPEEIYTPAPAPSSSQAVESSSAAPSATPASNSPSYSGGKRGLAYNDAKLCSSFAGKASWAYSWGSTPGGDLPEGMSFIPMPWIKNGDASTWLKQVDDAVSKGTTVVMGFNEVDHPAQSNLDPSTACQKWSEYMNPIASSHPDVTILGPSVTNAGDKPNWGLDWYKNFMSVCPGATWHAVNIHFYDMYQEGEGMSSTINRFKAHIENAAELTGKPVWLTEFGLNPGSTTEQTTKFLTEALAYLDGSDKVHGYSYFMVGTGENQLNAGDGLSQIGQIYASS